MRIPMNRCIAMPSFDMPRILRLAKEGGWIVIGQIASVLGSLVLVRVLTEHLDPEQYGQLALGLTSGVLICQTAMSGVMPGIMRYYTIAAEKQDVSGYLKASRKLMLYGTLAVLIMSLILLTSLLFTRYSQWLGLVAVAIIFTLLGSYNSTLSSIQNAARQRMVVAFHGGLESWLKILFALGMLFWLGNSSTAVIMGYVLSSLVVISSQFFFVRRLIPQHAPASADRNLWMRQMWSYSRPFTIFNIFTWAQASSDRWALEAFTTTQDVGLYVVLFQLGYTPISMATGLMATYISPILNQRSGDATDHARNANVHKIAWRITQCSLVLTVLGFLLVFGLHEWIFSLFVAAEYRSVSYLLPWVVLAGGLFAAGQMLSLKLMSDMKTAAMLRPKLITAIAAVFFNLFGAYIASLHGIVAAAIVFAAFHFAWLALLASRRFSRN